MRREKGLSFQCSLEYSIFKATAGRAICLIIVYLNVLLKEIQNFFSFFPLSTAVRSALYHQKRQLGIARYDSCHALVPGGKNTWTS